MENEPIYTSKTAVIYRKTCINPVKNVKSDKITSLQFRKIFLFPLTTANILDLPF